MPFLLPGCLLARTRRTHQPPPRLACRTTEVDDSIHSVRPADDLEHAANLIRARLKYLDTSQDEILSRCLEDGTTIEQLLHAQTRLASILLGLLAQHESPSANELLGHGCAALRLSQPTREVGRWSRRADATDTGSLGTDEAPPSW